MTSGGAMAEPKIDPELYRRLKACSGNWNDMMDLLTEVALMSQDTAKLYLVALGYDPDTDEKTEDDDASL